MTDLKADPQNSPQQPGVGGSRLEGGELEFAEHAPNEDLGGIESLLDMDTDDSGCYEEDEEADGEEDGDGGRLAAEGGVVQQNKGQLGPTKEADYECLLNDIWPWISTKQDCKVLTPALVWQVARKRAPNFTQETRKLGALLRPTWDHMNRPSIHTHAPLTGRPGYEQEKLRINRFDKMDLLLPIFSSLRMSGYQGVPLHNITLDEVQHFSQAELLDAGGVVAASVVGVPKTSLHLAANYRTHAGILNVAAAVVDVVREYHPMHIDNLPREKAFFKGPSPLLLSSTSSEDLMFLLLGSDPDTSQDKGALRLAREAPLDVLLCEELKHLYTALTRPRNNVVVFDSNVKQRGPSSTTCVSWAWHSMSAGQHYFLPQPQHSHIQRFRGLGAHTSTQVWGIVSILRTADSSVITRDGCRDYSAKSARKVPSKSLTEDSTDGNQFSLRKAKIARKTEQRGARVSWTPNSGWSPGNSGPALPSLSVRV
ncbi:hypothetical protein ABBQ38_011365 [Trebouxia sp. C0009 RCD-2024]